MNDDEEEGKGLFGKPLMLVALAAAAAWIAYRTITKQPVIPEMPGEPTPQQPTFSGLDGTLS